MKDICADTWLFIIIHTMKILNYFDLLKINVKGITLETFNQVTSPVFSRNQLFSVSLDTAAKDAEYYVYVFIDKSYDLAEPQLLIEGVTITNPIIYIGKGKSDRFQQHWNPRPEKATNEELHDWLTSKLLLREDHNVGIIIMGSGLTADEAFSLEHDLMKRVKEVLQSRIHGTRDYRKILAPERLLNKSSGNRKFPVIDIQSGLRLKR